MKNRNIKINFPGFRFLIVIWTIVPLIFKAQVASPIYTIEECVKLAEERHESINLAELQIQYYRATKKTSREIPKTSLMFTQGQFNSIYKYDNNVTIAQTFPFPSLVTTQSALGSAQIKSGEINLKLTKAQLRYQISEVYYNLQHSLQEIDLLHLEDSIYDVFLKIEGSQTHTSIIKDLEKTSTEAQSFLLKALMNDNRQLITDNRIVLQTLIRSVELPIVQRLKGKDCILLVDTSNASTENHPLNLLLKQQIEIDKRSKAVEMARSFPDVVLGYFNQTIYGPANVFGQDYFLTTATRLQGFQLGLMLPIFYGGARARVKAAAVQERMSEEKYKQDVIVLNGQYKQAVNKYVMTKSNLSYYDEFMLPNAKKMINQALDAFNKNEISFFEYLQSLSKSLEIERNYVHLIHQNNMAVIQIEYLLSK